jgi:hypothetical protein
MLRGERAPHESPGGPVVDAGGHHARRDQQWQAAMGLSTTHAPFRFTTHRSRINWRVLHGIDVEGVVSWAARYGRAATDCRVPEWDATARVQRSEQQCAAPCMQLQATFLHNGLFWPPTPQPLRAAHIAFLFVQDSLQATNAALEQGRCAADGRALAYLHDGRVMTCTGRCSW